MTMHRAITRSIFIFSAALAAGLFAACERTSSSVAVQEPRAVESAEPERGGASDLHGLYVLRLGDGKTLTNHVGIPQALLRFSVDDSRVGLVDQWEAPSMGAERVSSVTAVQSTGALRISVDENYLVFTGRDQEAGRVRENAPQVIARFSLEDHAFDTSTRVPADEADGHYRAAISLDGRAYWAVGSSGGIHSIEHGAGAAEQVLDVTHHYRNIAFRFDTLWFSRSAGGTRGLYRTDPTRLPTSGGEWERVDLAAAGGRGWDRGRGGYGDFTFWNEDIVFIGNNHVIEVFEREDPGDDVWNRLDGENQSHITAGGQVHLDILERDGGATLFYTQGTGAMDVGGSGLWSVDWDAETRTFGEATHLADSGFGYSFGGVVVHGTAPAGEPVEVAKTQEPFIPESPGWTEIPSGGDFHLDSPYDFSGYQHKVQLHSHTNLSDGDHDPSWVMQAYEAIGYAAVAITDHDHMRWTPTLEDPGGHNIVFLPGVEYSGTRSQSWDHMVAVGIEFIHHDEGMLNRAAQIRQARRDGGAAWLAHPYDTAVHRRGWDRHQVIDPALDFDGMEIHNGGTYMNEPRGIDYPYKVDAALLSGKEIQVIAVDDFHRNPRATLDRGFVVINSPVDQENLTDADVLEALRAGNFFAAGRIRTDHPTPPAFTDIRIDGHILRVETDHPVTIDFISASHNYYTRQELDREPFIHRVTGATTAEYKVSPDDRWIRIKATRRGETGDSYAWSNPIHVRSGGP